MKFFGCLPLSFGAHLVGVVQWAGIILGVLLAISVYRAQTSATHPYEAPALAGIAFLPPALCYLAVLTTGGYTSKAVYALIYFISHFAVETYCLAVPIYYLAPQWNQQQTTSLTIYGNQGGFQITYTTAVDNN